MALFGRKKNQDDEQADQAVAIASDEQDVAPEVTEKEEDIKDLLEDVDVPHGQAGSAPADHPGAGSDITAPDTSTDLNSSGPTIIHPHQKDDEDDVATEVTSEEPAADDDALANNETHEEVSAPSDEPAPDSDEHGEPAADEEASHGIDIKTDDEDAKSEDNSGSETDTDEPASDSAASNEVVEDVDREVNDLITRLSNEAEGLDSEIANSEAKIKDLQGEIDSHKARKDEIDKKVAALKAVVDGSK